MFLSLLADFFFNIFFDFFDYTYIYIFFISRILYVFLFFGVSCFIAILSIRCVWGYDWRAKGVVKSTTNRTLNGPRKFASINEIWKNFFSELLIVAGFWY